MKTFCKKDSFLQIQLVTIIEMLEIPGELILNWDQTGIKMVPTNGYTMEQEGEKQVEITGRVISSKSLPIQVI